MPAVPCLGSQFGGLKAEDAKRLMQHTDVGGSPHTALTTKGMTMSAIPAQLVEQLSIAVARWDGRGPSDDQTLEAGKALASAATAVLTWDAQQSD
jgi:hypothetical protein